MQTVDWGKHHLKNVLSMSPTKESTSKHSLTKWYLSYYHVTIMRVIFSSEVGYLLAAQQTNGRRVRRLTTPQTMLCKVGGRSHNMVSTH